LVYCGVVAPETIEAHARVALDLPDTAVLAVTSPDRLYQEWNTARLSRSSGRHVRPSHVEELLGAVPAGATLLTVIDGHPATLAWLGGVHGHRTRALGVTRFGQSGDLLDTYAWHGLDGDAIVDAVAAEIASGRIGASS
jgi:pyruvate dehydrogenase E1 component